MSIETPFKYAYSVGLDRPTGRYPKLNIAIDRVSYSYASRKVTVYGSECSTYWNLGLSWQTDHDRNPIRWYGGTCEISASTIATLKEMNALLRKLSEKNNEHGGFQSDYVLDALAKMKNAIEVYNDPRMQGAVAIEDYEKIRDVHTWMDCHNTSCTVHGYTESADAEEAKTAVAAEFVKGMDRQRNGGYGFVKYEKEFEAWLQAGRPVRMICAPDVLRGREPKPIAERLEKFAEEFLPSTVRRKPKSERQNYDY